MFAPPRRRLVLLATGSVALGLTVAACFHGPSVTPTASLGPSGTDSGPARSRGPFAVVYAAPRGHAILRQQPGITVLFSRGVRSVDMGDEDHVPPLTVRTKDGGEVAGSWRWTGTRGLLFTPRGELPGGSDFTVTVPAGTRALDGAAFTRSMATPGRPSPSTPPARPPRATPTCRRRTWSSSRRTGRSRSITRWTSPSTGTSTASADRDRWVIPTRTPRAPTVRCG